MMRKMYTALMGLPDCTSAMATANRHLQRSHEADAEAMHVKEALDRTTINV